MPDVPDSVSDHGRRRQFISRRKFWMEAGMGIGGLALIDLMSQEKLLAAECVGSAGVSTVLTNCAMSYASLANLRLYFCVNSSPYAGPSSSGTFCSSST